MRSAQWRRLLFMAAAMALAIAAAAAASSLEPAMTVHETTQQPHEEEDEREEEMYTMPEIGGLHGGSRFLAEFNPHKRLKCKHSPDICKVWGSPGPDCCKNKCVDMATNSHNCGQCGHKCKFIQACCRGQCVDLAFDKRHCGRCNNRCTKSVLCIYGLCNYA
ncbi:hypothetical protein AMTR_s00014p00178050 [Amborella trichopoda]|uniref:Stigma-specific STIG1-like protein 1 n=2 Tax=Amborella trichopoda TaxID=13333 RepID=W1PMW8_AMBTC|nr:hypothetical protein AMTR_s00014p00178050 [Amborella trichopoda]